MKIPQIEKVLRKEYRKTLSGTKFTNIKRCSERRKDTEQDKIRQIENVIRRERKTLGQTKRDG